MPEISRQSNTENTIIPALLFDHLPTAIHTPVIHKAYTPINPTQMPAAFLNKQRNIFLLIITRDNQHDFEFIFRNFHVGV